MLSVLVLYGWVFYIVEFQQHSVFRLIRFVRWWWWFVWVLKVLHSSDVNFLIRHWAQGCKQTSACPPVFWDHEDFSNRTTANQHKPYRWTPSLLGKKENRNDSSVVSICVSKQRWNLNNNNNNNKLTLCVCRICSVWKSSQHNIQ